MNPANPLEALPIAKAMREMLWLYPAVEIVHIVGFSLLVGSIAMFDVRVLGLNKQISVRALARHLLPWTLGALVLIVPTGFLMFSAHASDFISNRAFQLKMLLLLLAGVGAALFHSGPYRTVSAWDTGVTAPVSARLLVSLSLATWLAIISCGRLLAYL